MVKILSKLNFFDFEDYFSLVKDEKVMAMITEKVLSEAEARNKFNEIIIENDLHPEYGYYKISDLSGNVMGVFKMEIDNPTPHEAEIGYMLHHKFWGQGIAGEVSTFFIEKTRKLGELKRIYGIIDPLNSASRKILTNNGFKSLKIKDFEGLSTEILELYLP